MKKILPIFLCLILALALTACGNSSSASSSSGPSAEETSMTAQEMYDAILEAAPMNSPQTLDDSMLNDLFYVESGWTDEYVAAIAMMNVSADNIAVIHVTEGNAQNVADALQKRVEDVCSSFEQYLPDQYEKAQNALIVTKGDWVFMAVNEDYDAVQTAIDGFFA